MFINQEDNSIIKKHLLFKIYRYIDRTLKFLHSFSPTLCYVNIVSLYPPIRNIFKSKINQNHFSSLTYMYSVYI